jgi:hypothetical protein
MKVSPHRPSITRLVAVGLAAGALAAPAAGARPLPPDPPPPSVEPAPVVQSIDDGLDWGSAAIGAGGAGALIVVVTLGGLALTSRHRIGGAR